MYCPNPDCPDLNEAGIPAEYLPEITHCPLCGAALVPKFPDWAVPDTPPDNTNLVPVLKITNAALLPLAKSLLESADIDFTVRNELVQGLIGGGQFGTGFNPLTGPPEIYVEECNLHEARTLLEQLGQSDEKDA